MKAWHLNIWKIKISLSQEQKQLSCSKALSFRHTKQTSENVAGTTFKDSVRFFSFFFFTKWQPLNNYKKCFLFHLKSSFQSRDFQNFVFPSSPLFFPVSHWLKGWLKINLKVYDISNCLDKNSITHFVWYFEGEKR